MEGTAVKERLGGPGTRARRPAHQRIGLYLLRQACWLDRQKLTNAAGNFEVQDFIVDRFGELLHIDQQLKKELCFQ